MRDIGYKTVVVRYGELALKSQRVRRRFEETLVENIIHALNKKNLSHSVVREWGRIYVYGQRIDEITQVLTRIFGVVSVSPAFEVEADVDVVGKMVVSVLKNFSPLNGKSFALRVTRTGRHCFTSQDLAVAVGDFVRKKLGLRVDLDEPDLEVFIEVRGNRSFVYMDRFRGPGGLPAGTQGRVVALIRDKKDVLASWFLLRRGCSLLAFVVGERGLVKPLIEGWFLENHVILVERFKGGGLRSSLSRVVEKYNVDAVVVGDTFRDFKSHVKEGNVLETFVDLPVLRPLLLFEEEEVKERVRELRL